jgi:PhnB protein
MDTPDPASFEIQALTPHIVVDDAARAADWYARAFGARERGRVPLPDGKLMSVEMSLGDSPVMLADEFPEMGVLGPRSVGGTSTVLTLRTDDVDALWARAVDAGADVLRPLADQFWGERHGQVVDPFGHRWGLTQRVREVSDEQVVRLAAEVFGSASENR